MTDREVVKRLILDVLERVEEDDLVEDVAERIVVALEESRRVMIIVRSH